jgi:hypothetical protein
MQCALHRLMGLDLFPCQVVGVGFWAKRADVGGSQGLPDGHCVTGPADSMGSLMERRVVGIGI